MDEKSMLSLLVAAEVRRLAVEIRRHSIPAEIRGNERAEDAWLAEHPAGGFVPQAMEELEKIAGYITS